MGAVAVASSKNEGEGHSIAGEGKKQLAALPRAAAVTARALSLLFAGLTAWFLHRSGAGDDECLSAIVRRLAPLICACLFSSAVALSDTRRAATLALVRASYVALLADAASALAGPAAVAAAMLLATVHCAAAAGRALAERQQRAGTERSSAAAARSTPRYRSRAEERHEQYGRVGFFAAITVMVARVPAGLCLVAAPEETEAGLARGEAALVVVAGPCLLATRLLLLRERPLVAVTELATLAVAFAALVGLTVSMSIRHLVYGPAMNRMMIAMWLVAMATAGYMGYGLAVHARYKQLMTIKRYIHHMRPSM
ncbi:hypothetical protein ACP70R_048036 [Stipagrostis hirtigluma subsp. patula]